MYVQNQDQMKYVSDILQRKEAKVSFSQLGEDGTIWWMLGEQPSGFYVDVGCHHPFRFSNTAALHIFNGWRGVNIDVDERAIDLFKTHRPGDINICGAVGGEAGVLELTLFQDGAVNTLDPHHAANPYWQDKVIGKRSVQVDTLAHYLDRHLPEGQTIDLLSIDLEGLDLASLQSNDWERYRPKVIAIETHDLDLGAPAANPTFCFLRDKGYQLVSHTVVTSIYRSL